MAVLKVGTQFHSNVCSTAVIVVRPADAEGELTCGGQPMLESPPTSRTGSPAPGLDGGTLIGKRYEHESGLEVVCTKAGDGTLAFNGQPLTVKGPTPLPSSD
jgi:hypothetical protein